MSKDWTPAELQAASEAMKAAGHLSYEEFCEALTANGDLRRKIAFANPLSPFENVDAYPKEKGGEIEK